MRRCVVLMLSLGLMASCSEKPQFAGKDPTDEGVEPIGPVTEPPPPGFEAEVDVATEVGGTRVALEAMAEQVNKEGITGPIADIARMGKEAEPLGPQLMTWMRNHPKEEGRVLAVRALGMVGYQPAREPLELLLTNFYDWRLAYAATKSLVQLGDKAAIPRLEKAAKDHWFPIVRESAANAVAQLKGEAVLENETYVMGQREIDKYNYVDRSALSIPKSDIRGLKPRQESEMAIITLTELHEMRPELSKLIQPNWDPEGENPWPPETEILLLSDGSNTYFGSRPAGREGKLQAATIDNRLHFLRDGNTQGLVKWRKAVWIAMGTRGNDGLNFGALYRVIEEHGRFEMTENFILPGCPRDLWVTQDDKLVIECDGGTMVFESIGQYKYYSGKK